LNISIQILTFESLNQLESVELRRQVLRIPLDLDYSKEELAAEFEQVHLGAILNGHVVGVLLLVQHEDGILKMRQFAVDSAYQGKGIGTKLVEYSEFWAKQNNFTRISLHARDTAVSFYQQLGYKIKGEQFTEVGIPHRMMMKEL